MRIEVGVLALYPEIAVFAAVLPRVGIKGKPGQGVCLVEFRCFEDFVIITQ